MRSRERQDVGIAATAVRAVGRAVGQISRLRPDKARSEGRPRPFERQRPKEGVEAVRAEIRRIEGELDSVYAEIVGDGSGEEPATLELNDLIARSQSLKERLRHKRRDLTRIEREQARERRLGREQPAAPKAESRAAAGRRARRDRPGLLSRLLGLNRREGVAARRDNDEVRERVIRASFEDQSQRAKFDRLARNLADADADVRRAAATSLGDMGAEACVPVLGQAVDDPDEQVQIAALNALARIDDGGAASLFKRALAHESHHARVAALRGLSRAADTEALEPLVDALEDAHPAVRRTAADLLCWRAAKETVTPLRLALRDDDGGVRAASAAALGNVAADTAVLALLRALCDEEPVVREAALGSLKAILGEGLDLRLVASPDSGPIDELKLWWLKLWWRTARVERRANGTLPPLPREVGGAQDPEERTGASEPSIAAPVDERTDEVVRAEASETPVDAASLLQAETDPAGPLEDAIDEGTDEEDGPVEEEYESIF